MQRNGALISKEDRMKRQEHNKRGVAIIEMTLSMLVMVPLLLGTAAIGLNLVRTHETIQLARDAGNMYARSSARGINFAQPGNKTILANIGSNLGLQTTPGQGTAVVILSALTYVDIPACSSQGLVSGGVPTAECTNYTKWVFTQRIVIGNSAVRTSILGTPTGVVIDPITCKISPSDYIKKAGAVATFTGVNPYSVVNNVAQGLPSGQQLFIAEAGSLGFNMPPFVSNAVAYSWGMF